MNAFLVELENKPGEIARISEAIADRHINITALSGVTCGSSGRVALMTNDEAGTRAALDDAPCSYKEMEATEAQLRDEPGTLARAARRLADAGINVEALLPMGSRGNEMSVAFVTDNPSKARGVLAQVRSGTA